MNSIVKLINLPQPNSLDDRLDPPLGMMYIAGVLRANGKNVQIIDLAFVEHSKWASTIGYADIYGMTVFSASLYLAKEVTCICKENNPDCITVAGGPHATSLPQDTLMFFDKVVVGEGEYSFESLRYSDIIQTYPIDNLDNLPLPTRDLIDIHAYTRLVDGKPATSITTSRGCPYSCAFCCKDVFGNRVRYFSIERVVSEIKHIKETYGIKAFIFYDDTFALDRRRFWKLCAELEKLDIVYRCNGDARHNTLEDFQVLYRSGCREIAFGIESGSQKILDFMGKGATVATNKNAIINAKKAGLITKAFLMIGNPGETKETVEETKKFMLEANPDQYTLFQFVPLPGCDVWNNPEKYGVKIKDDDFRNYYNIAGNNEGGVVIETEELTADDIMALKADLLGFLQTRRQRGNLQEYYK